MDETARLYLILLLLVAAGRLVELRVSRQHQIRLRATGSLTIAEPQYFWMAVFHGALLIACAVEVVVLNRQWYSLIGWTALVLFLASNALRWWAIRTLGTRWTVRVMSPSRLGPVTMGPYRYVRHPNYTAVFLEMLALPLIHSAWLTAVAGTIAHVFILRNRVRLEESILMQDVAYRMAFERKPRFFPGLLQRETDE